MLHNWFGPTSTPLLVMLCVAWLAVFGVAVGLLPRHRRPGVVKYLVQAVTVLVLAAISVLAIGVKLNIDNQWFGHWSDLTANDAHNGAAEQSYGTPAPAVTHPDISEQKATDVQGDPRRNPLFGSQLPAPGADVSKGVWVTVSVKGNDSRTTQKVLVWLPPSYLQDAHRFYPVVMAFGGYPGTINAYRTRFPLDTKIATLAAAHQLRESIVVVPDVFLDGHRDTECVDATAPNGLAMETFVATDLVAWLRANLRTVNQPGAWTTLGYSAGGWCASMIALRHPGDFGHAVNLAGYFNPTYDGVVWRDVSDPRYVLADVVRATHPKVALWFLSAQDDRVPMASFEKFRPAIAAPMTVTQVMVPHGGHSPALWDSGMDRALLWLGTVSPWFVWSAQ